MQRQEPFRVSGKDVFQTFILSPRTGWPLWSITLAGLALTAYGCISDIRLLVAGLMICLTVTPTVGCMMHFNHIMSPDIITNLLPHTVERRDNGYTIRTFRIEETDNDDGDKDETWIESGSLTVYDTSVIKIKEDSTYKVIYLSDSPISVLYVPKTTYF